MTRHTSGLPRDVDDEPGGGRLKVLIADDHPMVIAGLRRTIEGSSDIEIVGEAHTGPELMRLMERRRPGLVVLDLRMPGVTGVEHIEEIHRTWPEVKIVVLSATDDRRSIDSALRAGAGAYVVKSATSGDIASVLRQSWSGAVFHSPSSGVSPIDGRRQPEEAILTDRETTILAAVAAGGTTAAISRDLWVSEHTIKFHLTNIYRKLGVANRAGAIRYAFENDLLAA